MPETNNMAHERLGPLLPNSLSLDSQIQIRAKGEPGSTWRTVRLQEGSLGKQDGRMGPSRFDDGLGEDFQPTVQEQIDAARGLATIAREMAQKGNEPLTKVPTSQDSTLKKIQLKRIDSPSSFLAFEIQPELQENETQNATRDEAGNKLEAAAAGILAGALWVGDRVQQLADTILYGRRSAINRRIGREHRRRETGGMGMSGQQTEAATEEDGQDVQDEKGMTSTMREEGQSPNEGTPSHVAAAPNETPVLRVLRPLQQPTELSGVRRILRPSVAPQSNPEVDDFWEPPSEEAIEVPDWVREMPRSEAEPVSPVTSTGSSEVEEPLETEKSPIFALDDVLCSPNAEWKGLSSETVRLLSELNKNPCRIFALLLSATPEELAQIRSVAEETRDYRFVLMSNNTMAYYILDKAIETNNLG